ncbi:MAG: hypothetical protein ACLRWQ_23685 [Flavonifractor plautii]
MEVLATKFDAAVVGRNNRPSPCTGWCTPCGSGAGSPSYPAAPGRGLIQCVCPRRPEGVREECAVSVSGLTSARTPGARRGGAGGGPVHGALLARRALAGAPVQKEFRQPGHTELLSAR